LNVAGAMRPAEGREKKRRGNNHDRKAAEKRYS